MGIYHQIKTTFTDDYGRQLENAVFLHLRRKHQEIFYFNKQGECDFVLVDKGRALKCVQVCWQIGDMNMKREIQGLKSALDYFGLNDGVIVTYNQTDLFEIEGVSIKLTPAWKYMMAD